MGFNDDDILYIHYLSDHPIYLICSFWAAARLGDECLGMLVSPTASCPDHYAYAMDDDWVVDVQFRLEPVKVWPIIIPPMVVE